MFTFPFYPALAGRRFRFACLRLRGNAWLFRFCFVLAGSCSPFSAKRNGGGSFVGFWCDEKGEFAVGSGCGSQRKDLLRSHLHSVEREQLLAEVFEGGAEVVNGVVGDEEAVVETVGSADFHKRVLSVVALKIHGQRFGNPPRDDGGMDPVPPFG